MKRPFKTYRESSPPQQIIRVMKALPESCPMCGNKMEDNPHPRRGPNGVAVQYLTYWCNTAFSHHICVPVNIEGELEFLLAEDCDYYQAKYANLAEERRRNSQS